MMRMRMRTALLAGVLAAVTAGHLFAAAEGEEATTGDGRLVITMIPWTTRGTTLAPDSAVERHLEERFNVDLRPWYDIDSYDAESRQVRLATGDIPDYLGGFNPAYVDLGIVRELPQELIRAHMPGYMRWADHYLGEEVWRRTMVDGVNYAVPTALSMASTGQVIGFRGDWMRNLGYELEPVPGTDFYAGPDSLEAIERLLLAFRNEDPDGNGRKDSYGYAVWKNNDAFQRTILPSVFGAFGVQLNVWEVRGGNGYYSMVDPNYRDALKYVNTWWEKEIIHPNMPTMVRQDVLQAMANDEFGAWSELDAWMSNTGAGPWGAYREVNPDGPIAYSVTPAGPDGRRGTWYRDPNWGPWCVGVNASDEVAVTLLQMAEAIYTDFDEYAFGHHGGARGEAWEIDDRGYAIGNLMEPSELAQRGARMFSGHVAHIVPPIDKVYIAPGRHALQKYIEDNQVRFPGYGFRPTWNEDERALLANIGTVEQEFAWKALTGQVDVDQAWDGYVRAMMDAGLDRLLMTVADQGR